MEAADNLPGIVPVRDSKDPHGPALTCHAHARNACIADVAAGRFGRPAA